MNNFKAKLFVSVVFVFCFCAWATEKASASGSAHLAWNPVLDSELAGYKIYYDTSSHAGTCPSGYPNSKDVGKTNSQYIDSLQAGRTYFFQVTAYDASHVETACSSDPGETSQLITYRGDLDKNHNVNLSDVSIMAGDFNKTYWCGPTRASDINRDCTVDDNDMQIMAEDFGNSF